MKTFPFIALEDFDWFGLGRNYCQDFFVKLFKCLDGKTAHFPKCNKMDSFDKKHHGKIKVENTNK